jgi:hypothetical protein
MRTTLNIDNDILAAAKELARQEGRTAGAVLSELARKGLSGQDGSKRQRVRSRNGVPVLPRRKEVITVEKVRRLMDEEEI